MGPSILLVSGEEESRAKPIQSFLEQKGYPVSATPEPKDGFSIIVWYLASGKDNLGNIKLYKNRHPNSKLVLISDAWDKEDLRTAFRLGAMDCLELPHDLDGLDNLISRSVKEVQQENANWELLKNLRQKFETDGAGDGGSHLRLVSETDTNGSEPIASYTKIKKRWLEQFEKEYLVSTLVKYRGNVSAAARSARLDRSNFLRLLRKYGLQAEAYRRVAA